MRPTRLPFAFVPAVALLAACSAVTPPAAPAAPATSAASAASTALPDTGNDMSPSFPVVGKYLLFDDFEHGMDAWKLDGGAGNVSWGLLKAHSCTGEYVMHFGHADQSDVAAVGTEATLQLAKPVELAGTDFPVLTYTVKGETLPTSALTMQVELRHPGGAWQAVGVPTQARYSFGYTRYLDMRTQTRDAVDLRFRIHLDTAAAATAGMYLDDVGIVAVQRDP